MAYRLLADAVLLLHLAFILFVMLGAVLVWRWPRLIYIHLAAVAWGMFVEIAGRICPLTPLEIRLRQLGGELGYRGSFIEHYLLPVIYPDELTRTMQLGLVIGIILVNSMAYAYLYGRAKRKRRHG